MQVYSNILGEDISTKLGYSSNIINLFRSRRKSWLEESGHVLQKQIYERPGITADAEADFVDGDGYAFPESIKANNSSNYGGTSTGDGFSDNRNNVDPPTDTLTFSYNNRGYGLIQKAYEGPDMSLESLRAAAKREQAVSAVTQLMTNLTREYWVRIHRDELNRIADNRFICLGSSDNPSFREGTHTHAWSLFDANRWNQLGFGTTYVTTGSIDNPNTENISILTLGHLEEIYVRMVEEGGAEFADTFVDGQPLFILLTSLQTKRRLLTEGSTNGRDVRTDIRESSKADELLKPMGVTTAVNGFVMLPEVAPRRFDITGDSASSSGAPGQGDWVERNIYTTSGNTRIINSAYRSAAYEESYILVPRAINCYAPKPFGGVGPVQFPVQNYMGEYSFNVIKHRTDNPDGAHGFFRAKLGSATSAEAPYLIYVLRHLKGEGTAA